VSLPRLTPERLHLGLTLLWAALLVPTLLWWRESVFWVIVMSWYANVSSSWSAYESARAARKVEETGGAPKTGDGP
jgi:hypothetical protein